MKGSWARIMGGCGALVMASMFTGCLPTGGSNGSGNSNCDSDEVRARPTGLPRACYALCETQADCDGATTCTEVNSGNEMACLPEAGATNNPVGCTSNAQCSGATPICTGGECVAATGGACLEVSCESGFVCREGTCVEDTTPECTADAQCGAGEICQGGACVEDTTGGVCNFNSDCRDGEICRDGDCIRDPSVECVQDRDCSGAGEVCQNSTCIVPVDPVDQACVAFCQNLYGSCVKSTCGGLDSTDRSNLDAAFDRCLNGGTSPDGSAQQPCAQNYRSDSQYAAEVDQLGSEACGSSETLQNIYCGSFGFGSKCGCVEPSLGESCRDDGDCEGGAITPFCIPEVNSNTGEDTGFTGGYCVSASCDAGSQDAGAIAAGATTGCGENGLCLNEQVENGVQGICYELCGSRSDCRSGYSCEILAFFTSGDPAGRCMPACNTNTDCPTYTIDGGSTDLNAFCNTDKWCEFPCDPSDGNSCGSNGSLTCRSRSGFNANTSYTGSCEVTR